MADKKVKLSDIRAQFPMYGDVSDDQLLAGLHKKYYADIPRAQFLSNIDYDTNRQDPTADMSTFGKLVAGYGSALPRLARGVGQTMGLISQEEVDYRNGLDAPLLKTGAGATGNVLGNVALAVPTAAIPGAAAVPGAAAIGAVLGFLAPSSSDESPLKNAAIGAAAGPVGIWAGRGLNALYQGGRSLIEPFFQRGREAIGGRVLEQFGITPQAVAGLSGGQSVTGARPMLAEVIQDPTAAAGAARLQGAIRTADPRAGAAMEARAVENNAARVSTLEELGGGAPGSGGARDFAVAERAGTSGPMYQEAFSVDAGSAMTPELQRELTTLMRSPAIQQAARAARANAANSGTNVGPANASGSVEGLHNMKLALDDAITMARGGNGSPAQATKAEGLIAARDRLVSFIEQLSPEYASARGVHRQMSRPVNQMDVARELLARGAPERAGHDLGGNPRLMPNALLGALGDEQGLIQGATGRDLGRGGLNALYQDAPESLARMRAVGAETDRAAAVARAENGPGSATAQRLASSNVLRQTLGPLGAPESWSESTLLNTFMRPVQFGYNQVAEPRIQQVISEALLDPSRAAALLQQARSGQIRIPDNALTQLAAVAARNTPAAIANRPQ